MVGVIRALEIRERAASQAAGESIPGEFGDWGRVLCILVLVLFLFLFHNNRKILCLRITRERCAQTTET